MSSHQSTEFELNLAPIIDCLTVLITFLLASASFLSIGLLDAGVAAGGDSAKGEPPAVQIRVELNKDQSYRIEVSGKMNQKITIPAKDSKWDRTRLESELGTLKKRWPEVSAATVAAASNAEDSIEYKDVVQTMDTARKTHPAVLLGGF